jgi:hypothetical protein
MPFRKGDPLIPVMADWNTILQEGGQWQLPQEAGQQPFAVQTGKQEAYCVCLRLAAPEGFSGGEKPFFDCLPSCAPIPAVQDEPPHFNTKRSRRNLLR